MEYICNCSQVSIDAWNGLMKGTRPCSGRLLRNKIKKYLPMLYNELCLDFYNPYEEQCRKSKDISVYVHSGIEYFIRLS